MPAGLRDADLLRQQQEEVQQLRQEVHTRTAALEKRVREMEESQAQLHAQVMGVSASSEQCAQKAESASAHAQQLRVEQVERVQEEMDQQRPKRETLSREAGRWPRDSPARWLGRKGQLMVKRSGVFGQLPFGIGHHYTCVGTWSAEPEEPVETFWTMPD